MKYIYLHNTLYQAYGVKVIVNHLKGVLHDAVVTHQLDELPDDATVIPYGLLESVEVIRCRRFKLGLALMIDAYSLGEWSNFAITWRKSFIPLKYKARSLLKSIKYFFLEYWVLRKYDKIMLVSWGDKQYYEKCQFFKSYANKIIIVPNGVNLPEPIPLRVRKANDKINVGCLSPWWGPSYYTLQFFLNEVWKKIKNKDNIKLIIAGRGITPEKQEYMEKFENVEVIGEVGDLKDFYSQIDISLITMLKKCGIINRVLDGFSYQVPVLCREQSLLAFKDLPDCCYTYMDADSFVKSVRRIVDFPEEANNKVSLAYNFVSDNHNWNLIYQRFANYIEKKQ